VYIDEQLIGSTAGMFAEHEFYVGYAAKTTIHLSVVVWPPDYPGVVTGDSQGGDHAIAKNGPI